MITKQAHFTVFLLAFLSTICALPLYNRTFLIDRFENNLLFRTNDPTNATTLDYDTIVSFFRKRTEELHLTFPSEFTLVAISLVNDKTINDKEEQFFEQNPELGYFLNYPLVSDESKGDPLQYKAIQRLELALTYPLWTKDHLGRLVNKIRAQVVDLEPIDRPKVVFFHCFSGINIVFEGFGSYMIKVHDWTYKQVLQWNAAQGLPPALPKYENSVSWYCYSFADNHYFDKYYDCGYRNSTRTMLNIKK